ncbi:hypothetical protein COO60DRAFT_1639598 [Scenedesmus sp. NREL 46B-D3]|nr:hypothetical protein COO60DRAFT_1639598 [Scenedesmus sp. NREL 46B-D3]
MLEAKQLQRQQRRRAPGGLGGMAAGGAAAGGAPGALLTGGVGQQGEIPSPPQRGARERELREARDQLRDQLAGDASEVLNERAMAVMRR